MKLSKLNVLGKSRKLLALTPLLFAPGSAHTQEPAPQEAAAVEAKTDFIRVSKTDKNVFLETGVTTYTKGDVTVDLIGAVHIGDKTYYEQLNTEFTNYESLLYELVGGENIKQQLKQAPPADNKDAAKKGDIQMRFLSSSYNKMMEKLDLSGQMQFIDYSMDNFVHADLTLKQFNDLQKEKGESLFKLALQNAFAPQPENVKQPSSIALLRAMLFGTPNDLKLMVVETLGSGDDQIAAFAGKQSVIIGDRNAKCIEVMQSEVNAGKNNIGIFYGAAHFPDLEERMIKLGYTKTKHRWIKAWTIDQKKRRQAKPATVDTEEDLKAPTKEQPSELTPLP